MNVMSRLLSVTSTVNLLNLPVTLRTTRFNIQQFYIVIIWNVCVLYGYRKKTANFTLCNARRLVVITEVESVYSAVRTESLYRVSQ